MYFFCHFKSLDSLVAMNHCTHYVSVNLMIVSKQLVQGRTVLHSDLVAIA